MIWNSLKNMQNSKLITMIFSSAILLAACGGGGSNSATNPTSPISGGGAVNQEPTWQIGVFSEQATFKDICETPRTGIDPFSGSAFPDRAGTAMHEKMWLRSWSDETYLWYDEIDDNDPRPFQVLEYFNQLKTNERTDSGSLKDNFHFSQSTEEYNERTQSGVSSGYGISWEFVRNIAPRKLVVRYTEPGSPAALAGVERGDEVRFVDDVDFVNASSQEDIDSLNAGLFPDDSGENHRFTFFKPGTGAQAGSTQVIDLTSANVEIVPVQNVAVLDTPIGRVGYMQFNTYIRAAQPGLIDAFNRFNTEGITDLVVDLRYNGGGLLAMSSQLAFMVAGSAQTNGLTFETTQYNDKNPNRSPVTGRELSPTPFYDREIDYAAGQFTTNQLPSVNLTRVFVLATGSTCSASEAFINGLRGIDVEVILVGDTTCGKPYGFFPQDNCGTTYFTIQFTGINEKGFGEYSDGFIPTPTPRFAAEVQGCAVEDDFTRELGDINERMLSSALSYAETGECPIVPSLASKTTENAIESGRAIKAPNTIYESIVLENKILTTVVEPR